MKTNLLILNKETQLKELKQNLKIKVQKENLNRNSLIPNYPNKRSSNASNAFKSEKRDISVNIKVQDDKLNTSSDLTDNLNNKKSFKNLLSSNIKSKKRDV
jgi:hypothetical protein